MAKSKKKRLEFEIDKLTRSIENAVTGERFATQILPVSKDELKSVNKKQNWLFDWKAEFAKTDREVYKLVTVENLHVIQGLVCFSVNSDHVFMNLIESAPFNRLPPKIYLGVAGNLVAYLCKVSFASGGGGFVSFLSKTKLIGYYERSLGAVHEGGHLMVIYPEQATQLVKHYFENSV